MLTKKYCPDCGSLRIWRLKRSFFSRIAQLQPIYECNDCGEQFTFNTLLKNQSIDFSNRHTTQTATRTPSSQPTSSQDISPHINLSKPQEADIINTVLSSSPNNVSPLLNTWNQYSVRELIYRDYNIILPMRTVLWYLKKWGLNPEHPLKDEYQKRPETITQWSRQEYQDIKNLSKETGAEIHWIYHKQVVHNSEHENNPAATLIYSINPKNQLDFLVYPREASTTDYTEYLSRLTHTSETIPFIVINPCKDLNTTEIGQWNKKHLGECEVFSIH